MKARVAIVGDFNPDFLPHRATDEALDHAAVAEAIELDKWWTSTAELNSSDGLIALQAASGFVIAPGSPYRSMTGALTAISFARKERVPLLATCGGFQHVLLEYARNVLGFPDAEHAEYDPYASRLIITKLNCSLVGRTLPIHLQTGSRVAEIYGREHVEEQHYCNFGVNPEYAAILGSNQLRIVGFDSDGGVRVVEMLDHPFFVGTLFVPQLSSTAKHPHPLLTAFLRAASVIETPSD